MYFEITSFTLIEKDTATNERKKKAFEEGEKRDEHRYFAHTQLERRSNIKIITVQHSNRKIV